SEPRMDSSCCSLNSTGIRFVLQCQSSGPVFQQPASSDFQKCCMLLSLSGGCQWLNRILVQCQSNSFCSCVMTLGKNSIAKALNYGANWRGWAERLHQVGDGEDKY